MPRRKITTLIALFAACILQYQSEVEAAEFRSGINVNVNSDEVIGTDMYAFGRQVVIDGVIEGDLVAASESVLINGAVNGDLILAGRSIIVNGSVEDDIRAAGADLSFLSSVGGDVIVAGNEIAIDSGASIGEDLVVSANSLLAGGEVRGNVELNAVDATLTGTVRGRVNANVEESLTLSPESRIEGALNYTSQNEARVQAGATVIGDTTQFIPTVNLFGNEYPFSILIDFVSKIISQARWFIGTLLVGLILIWLFPGTIQDVSLTLSHSPWKSLALGVLVFPLAAIMLLLSMIIILSSIGFSGFPIIAIPALGYVAMLLLAKPVIAVSVGSFLKRRAFGQDAPSLAGSLALGAAILAVVGLIPVVDTVVGWATLLLGFGMWLLFFFHHYREARSTRSV